MFDPRLSFGCVICRRESAVPYLKPGDETEIGLGRVALYGAGAFLLVCLLYLGWAYSGDRSSNAPFSSWFEKERAAPPPARPPAQSFCSFVVYDQGTAVEQTRQYCSALTGEEAVTECGAIAARTANAVLRGRCGCTADPTTVARSCRRAGEDAAEPNPSGEESP